MRLVRKLSTKVHQNNDVLGIEITSAGATAGLAQSPGKYQFNYVKAHVLRGLMIIVFILLTVSMGQAFAFNSNKCTRFLDRGTLVSGPIYLTTSSFQFVSSTGACAAVGMNVEEEAKSFYSFNSDKVLEDIARGKGEYYSSLSALWGCKQDEAVRMVHPLRRGYSVLLKLEVDRQYEFIKKQCSNEG